jgi:endonuclease/exonuclease/phosphatase family metal-dependent hydrolase
MSFNIQVGYRSSTRDEQVIEMIKKYDADVIGLQEASLDWIQTILKACPEYTYVGKSRDGSLSGEYNPILYKEDKFTLIDSTTKWLSPTPDVVSRFPESNMNRITTIAILRRNSDGRTFVHANTHLHHDNDTARTLQAEVLIKLLGDYSDYPIFISGDFNASYSALCISRIKDAEYESSEYLAYKCQSYITTNNKWGGGGGGVIDYIFSHPNKTTILSYRVCTEMINGSYASDHNPLYIEAIIP